MFDRNMRDNDEPERSRDCQGAECHTASVLFVYRVALTFLKHILFALRAQTLRSRAHATKLSGARRGS